MTNKAARNAATPQPYPIEAGEASASNGQLPEEWTAKLSSDDFIKQWYSAKGGPAGEESQNA